jgi:hypothetical protein
MPTEQMKEGLLTLESLILLGLRTANGSPIAAQPIFTKFILMGQYLTLLN